ncbi:hypothetical protein HNR06_001036 [Nocardiopsis arvandica]|uniref:Knr4/Smi1-like domain-containing protein n=1 Tax=Nocardiopsis sinuspersici TaxID=501010 RepID=A0A7Y9XAK4_9ACTN|nr:SMI1/KNR4 family protein [Nocardiopsis sinuspersici]NYH51447.1 hypothetical protein [Nocardiopsis sinuspersici]
MTGTTAPLDFAGALARGLRNRNGAWEFIRAYADRWTDGLDESDGWEEADLDAAENRMGLRLPAALREAYRLFARRTDLTGNHDRLLAPSELYVDAAREALVFRHENQGAASWGILLQTLREEDPAVLIRADLADRSVERWERWMDRFSVCCVEIVLSESVQAGGEVCGFLHEPAEEDLLVLEQTFVRLPLPQYPAGGNGPGIRWFLGQDVLVRDDGAGLLVRGLTAEALDRFRGLTPGEWIDS